MKTHTHIRSLIALLLLLLLCSPFAQAAKAEDQHLTLNDFVLDNSEGQLMLRFGVGLAQLEELKIMLKEGGKVALTCEARLSSPSTLWFDSVIASQQLKSHLHYDSLTREYVITYDGKPAPFRHSSLKHLFSSTWNKLSLSIGQASNLQRGERYKVTLNTTLENSDVAPWLSTTLFFWTWNVAPSQSYSMSFTF